MGQATNSPNASCITSAVTGSSAAIAIVDGADYKVVRIINSSSSDIHYRFGASGVTAVKYSGSPSTGDPIVAAGTTEDVWSGGATHVAFIVDSGSATVRFQPIQYKG